MTEQDRYKLFQQAISDALRPALDELGKINTKVEHMATKDDVGEVRKDLREMQSQVYTREMMDAKLKEVWNEVNGQRADIETNSQALGTLWMRTAERIGIVISSLYALVNLLPHVLPK